MKKKKCRRWRVKKRREKTTSAEIHIGKRNVFRGDVATNIRSDADMLLLFFVLLCSANICSCHLFQFLSFDVLFYDYKYLAYVLPSFLYDSFLFSHSSIYTCYILILPTASFFPVLLRKTEVYFRKAFAIEQHLPQTNTRTYTTQQCSPRPGKKSNGNSVSTWHYSMCVNSISFVSLQIRYW